MARIGDLPLLAALPSARLLVATDDLRRAFSRERPGLFVGRAIHRQNRARLIKPGMQAWALTLAEVACARMPGGALVDTDGDGTFIPPGVDDEQAASSHDRTCGCGSYRNHTGEPWMRHMDETMWATRDRDGARLFAAFDAAMDGGEQAAHNYVASLASSSCVAAADAGLDRPRDALLHTLGFHAATPAHWSVAGLVYRLCSGTLTAMSMGPDFAEQIIGPEITALAALRGNARLAALAVVGQAYAEVMNDDPAEDVPPDREFVFEAHAEGHAADANASTRTQAQGAQYAGRVAFAYRRAVFDPSRGYGELVALVNQLGPGGVGLATFALSNLLAIRMHELYG